MKSGVMGREMVNHHHLQRQRVCLGIPSFCYRRQLLDTAVTVSISCLGLYAAAKSCLLSQRQQPTNNMRELNSGTREKACLFFFILFGFA